MRFGKKLTSTVWTVTIDQRSGQGGLQRYDHDIKCGFMSDAVEEAIDRSGLLHAEEGQYQITVSKGVSFD